MEIKVHLFAFEEKVAMSSKFFTSQDYSSWMAKMKNFEVLKRGKGNDDDSFKGNYFPD